MLFENLSDEPMQLWFEQGAPGDGARTLVAELRPKTQPLKSFAGHVIVWGAPDVIVGRTAIFRSLDRSTWRGGGRDAAAPLATVDSPCADRHPDFCPARPRAAVPRQPGLDGHLLQRELRLVPPARSGGPLLARCAQHVAGRRAWGGGPPGALDEMFATMNQRVAARYRTCG